MKGHKIILRLIAIAVLGVAGIAALYAAVRPGVPDFSDYEAGAKRKEAFFSYLLPVIEQRNQEILETRRQLKAWNRDRENIGWWDTRKIQDLAKEYEMETFDIKSDADWNTLLRRVDAVPPSLALAQAAKESAWGTSRFAREGYNFFGQWCFEEGCGIVPGSRETGKNHEIAVFDSPVASVESYIHNLNSHDAYRSLRDIRASLRAADYPVTGITLAGVLDNYSERGTEYVNELQVMISNNNLSQYDRE
jgi:Bax protein